MPSLCIGAETPTPRRPASGSVLSLAALCRHVVLQDPGKLMGCLNPVPSPTTLAFDLSGGSRHFRSPTLRFSWEGSYRDFTTVRSRYDLSTCSPPFVGADQGLPQPTEAFTSGLSTDWSPAPPPDITTGATGQVPLTGLSPVRTPTSIAATALESILAAGWQTISYRQNTELAVEAWHWNPQGSWSDPSGRGYFTGNATPGEPILHSYGYMLPHRGFTRNEGTETHGFSRMTDGDLNTYWKSNPYLTKAYTGQDDSVHPQWVVLDLAVPQMVNALRIAWAEPYARQYVVQYWSGDEAIKQPTRGAWVTFPSGSVAKGKGGTETFTLTPVPVSVRFIRIWMTESSNTC